MVRRNLQKLEGQRIVVEGKLEKSYKRGHDNCLIVGVVIRRNGREEDHMWICNDKEEKGNDLVRRVLERGQKVGDRIVLRGVVVPYEKRGVVDYALEQIDAVGVNGVNYQLPKAL